MDAVLATNLTRRFKSAVAVDGVSLSVSGGEMLAVVGGDGSGKTTLLQMLAAILDPTSGRCTVLGFDTVRQAGEVTARIGYMPQGFTLYDRLTVDENIEFAATLRGVERRVWKARRAQLLGMAGLERFAARRAGQLSGGMQKKLALCTNLIHEPRVLLLDEPSLGVDPLSRRELWELLREYRRQGTAIVLSTSYLDEAERCDRVILLHAGRELAAGAPAELSARADGPSGRRLQDIFMDLVAGSGAPSASPPSPPSTRAHSDADKSHPTVQVRDLTCRFGDFVAVDALSLALAPGEVCGFLGPNGAGKTTFMRILCGLQPFQVGDVEVAGVDVRRARKALRPRIGYMSQRFSLYRDLTVAENLEFFAGVYDLGSSERSRAIERAIEAAGLRGLGDRQVGEISAALRQRLALACSVMHGPEVLFLDEPTSGVDPLARHRFWLVVRELAATGITVIVTTHFMEEALYCDRLALMLDGRLIAFGSFESLREDAQLPKTTSGEDLFLHYIERLSRAA